MSSELVPSDVAILDLLRKRELMTVTELSGAMEVTATAVRQRLNRLMAQGHIERRAERVGRGRPNHVYRLTQRGRRQTGANFADLAVALWQEIRSIRDPEVRQGLLTRVSRRLAESYADQVEGKTLAERMESISRLFGQRQVPFEVDTSGDLPVLTALACPYPELAEEDRSVCAMERMLFSELAGESVKLTNCRLDGGNCCTFEPRN